MRSCLEKSVPVLVTAISVASYLPPVCDSDHRPRSGSRAGQYCLDAGVATRLPPTRGRRSEPWGSPAGSASSSWRWRRSRAPPSRT